MSYPVEFRTLLYFQLMQKYAASDKMTIVDEILVGKNQNGWFRRMDALCVQAEMMGPEWTLRDDLLSKMKKFAAHHFEDLDAPELLEW